MGLIVVLVSSSGQVSAELLSSVRTSETMAEFRESDQCRGECRQLTEHIQTLLALYEQHHLAAV